MRDIGRFFNRVAGAAAGLAALICLTGGAARAEVPTDDLVVHVYNVGQGSCVLIECPDGPPILNDCGKIGRGGNPDQAARKINDRLGDERAVYPTPLTVVISHPHSDHYSILTAAKYRISPDDIRGFYYAGPFTDFSVAARTWINKLAFRIDGRTKADVCSPTNRVTCLLPNEHALETPRLACGKAKIDLLTANAFSFNRGRGAARKAGQGSSPNGESAVLRLRYGGASLVLPGDAEDISQIYAEENASALGAPLSRTTVLLLPHHGSGEVGSNNDAWVAATSPKVVLVSANVGGGYGHPNCDVLKRFDAVTTDGQAMDPLAHSVPVSCGLDSHRRTEARTLDHRFVFTETNGDLTVVISSSGEVQILCETASLACPAAQ